MAGLIGDYRRRKTDEAIARQSGADPYEAKRQAMEDEEASEAERRRKMAQAMVKQGKDPHSPMAVLRRTLGLDP